MRIKNHRAIYDAEIKIDSSVMPSTKTRLVINKHERIVFTKENIFKIVQTLNCQKNRVWQLKRQESEKRIIQLKSVSEFRTSYWIFQQNSASPHQAKITQQWGKLNFPHLTSSDE